LSKTAVSGRELAPTVHELLAAAGDVLRRSYLDGMKGGWLPRPDPLSFCCDPPNWMTRSSLAARSTRGGW
jgi:hypothetical protein